MSQNTNECISLREERARRENRARIPVKCAQRNRFIPGFLIGVVVLSVISLLYLQIDWLKLASRVPDIGEVFWELAHLDFANMDLIWSSLIETISIAVLSLLYSLLLGIVFGAYAFARAHGKVWTIVFFVALALYIVSAVLGLC